MPTAVLQGLGQQFRALVGVLGARGTYVVEYGDGLAQPVHGRADHAEVGSGQRGGRPQFPKTALVRIGQCGHEGVELDEVGVARLADDRERAYRPRVVQRGQRLGEHGPFRLGLLQRGVERLLDALEPLVRVGQFAEAEDGGDRVVLLAGPAVEDLVEIRVRQEGAVVVQGPLPARCRRRAAGRGPAA